MNQGIIDIAFCVDGPIQCRLVGIDASIYYYVPVLFLLPISPA